METTTQPGVAASSAPVQNAAPSQPQDTVDQFQGLWEASVAAEGQQAETPEGKAQQEADAQQAQESEQQQAAQQTPEEIEAAKQAAAKEAKPPEAPPEEKAYSSLDEYLKDTGLDAEAFMGLPVTVKVDGRESAVPLNELVKGYQLSSASYDRMQQAAKEREAFSAEQTQVRQALGLRIQQVESLFKTAQDQLNADYNSITPQQWQELRVQNPGEYAALMQQFEQRQRALNTQLQQVAQAKQQETQAQNQERLQALSRERENLYQARPEWRDPAKFAAAREAMLSAGRKLGFSDAELQGVTDYRNLLVLDLAAQHLANQAKLQAQLPKTLKIVRAAPKMAAPGTRQVRDPKQAASQSARKAWSDSGFKNNDAAAAYFEQFA